MTEEPFRVQFHPEAATRFSEMAQDLLKSVKSFGNAVTPTAGRSEIHPVARITPDQIIGEVKVTESAVNRLGEEKGRYWTSNGLRVGWEEAEFDAIKDLAGRFTIAAPIKGMVSHRFLLDEVFKWQLARPKPTYTLFPFTCQWLTHARCSENVTDTKYCSGDRRSVVSGLCHVMKGGKLGY
jgi:hypothetical protein